MDETKELAERLFRLEVIVATAFPGCLENYEKEHAADNIPTAEMTAQPTGADNDGEETANSEAESSVETEHQEGASSTQEEGTEAEKEPEKTEEVTTEKVTEEA